MINRRGFVQAGVAASVGGAWFAARGLEVFPTAEAGRLRQARLPYLAAIFDERCAAGQDFAGEARKCAIDTRPIRGDVTDLWYSRLHPVWKQRPAPIAGLTGYGALFCLERLAWDHGMRVVYHGSHRLLADGAVEHVLAGFTQDLARPTGSPGNRSAWGASVAQLISRIEPPSAANPLPQARRSPQTMQITRGAPLGADAEHTLFSWVIAPTRRV